MSEQPVRVGIVGAGANTRARHIPGFRAIDGVTITGVCNRTPESTKRVAREFQIPQQYADWKELIAADDVDAVMIGTWPNMHCEITCAALEAGKHVLTEARMARNLDEAKQMLAASEAHADRVAQIVPSPYGLTCGPFVEQLIGDMFIGELRELVVLGADDVFWDYSIPLHWRQDREISGLNVLAMGILHETALRWAPPPTRVFAQSKTFEPQRPNLQTSEYSDVTVPDSVQIVTELKGGGRGMYHMSGVALFGPGKQIHLYGSRGTIKVEFEPEERVFVGHNADATLKPVEIPEEQCGRWRVEEEFIGAIRGQESVSLTSFADGVQYMQFVEGVARSSEQGAPVSLPIA
ncbi:MAG: Gfo/Idh/MocA family oxidoreductase [Planctomycetaceae bacterium]|nr:Gfo/Idh/MocA family oxidoreductase [Planctomycetaceae bacterium]